MHEMKTLLSLANKHYDSKMVPCTILYRTKSKEYFDAILKKNSGIMELDLKDAGGSPKSPINGRLGGVFFTASAERRSPDGDRMLPPPHGSSRLQVFIENLIKPSTHNLYFADFFCVGSSYHYVVLVVCEIGSRADHFCECHLPELDWDENNFITCSDGLTFKIVAKEHCIIDVFYANTINIGKLLNSKKASLVRDLLKHENGYSIYEGLKKYPHCQICNIHKPSAHVVTPDYYYNNNNNNDNNNNNNNNNNSPKPCVEQHFPRESEKNSLSELTDALPLDINSNVNDFNENVSPNQENNSEPCSKQPQFSNSLSRNGMNNTQKEDCEDRDVDSTPENNSPKPFLANSMHRYSVWACVVMWKKIGKIFNRNQHLLDSIDWWPFYLSIYSTNIFVG